MASEKAQTLHRVVAVLDCFTADRPVLGVREVARLIKLSSSTTGRLMAAMKDIGILNQDQETRMYSLGGKVLSWAGVYSATLDVRTQALPAMQDLHRQTQETISLYIMEGCERVCIERLESTRTVRITARLGRRMPLYAGSAGKVFLAFLAEARREEIFRTITLQPLTASTITDLNQLKRELRHVQENGYAVSHGEWEPEASGVAAPIFDMRGEILAALTISGPSQRFTPDIVEQYTRVVVQVARDISFSMGYREPIPYLKA